VKSPPASAFAYALLALGAACSGSQTPEAESLPPAAGNASEPAPQRRLTSICAGEPSGEVRTTDLDEDGTPETTKYYDEIADPERPGQRKSILVRQELDLTWDGRTDICRYFDESGNVVKEEWDLDYDGHVDEVRYYEEGQIVRSERDRNNDGRAEVYRYYAGGKLERKETDTNGDGQIDRWEYYDGRILDRVGVDKDGDGAVDTWAKAATNSP
jgi:antitoxin component YwqK of YwqJK toxin-antitoxin module